MSHPSLRRVTIAFAPDGRPNGMAFVEFDTPESAERAMAKDKQIIGTRCVCGWVGVSVKGEGWAFPLWPGA